jgi:hypothetical protein
MPNRSIWMQDVSLNVSERLELLTGSSVVLLSAILNIVVRGVNGWKMPVFTFDNMVLMDKFHVLGNLSTTNLKWLSDWISVGSSWIVSPGDILLTLGFPIYLIFTISIVVRKYKEAKRSSISLKEG